MSNTTNNGNAEETAAREVIFSTRDAEAPQGITEDMIRAKIIESGHQMDRAAAIRVLEHHAAIAKQEKPAAKSPKK